MNLYGRLTVSLADERDFNLNNFADTINANINPPRKVSGDDIYVRAIYLISDHVNSYGGRFPLNELEGLCKMIVDSPVLIGHNKSELPIARNFKAEVVTKEDGNWVKVWFYWLKETDGSEALLANIDGGIYKEGSIGFIYSFPECGICGKDIRECSHTPLKKYAVADQDIICSYNYRRIEKVLETSLVFRGANPDTKATNELSIRRKTESHYECNYKLYRIRKAVLLSMDYLDQDIVLLFPQFNPSLLSKGKRLIGYKIEQMGKNMSHQMKLMSGECGKLSLEEGGKSNQVISIRGKTLNGRYQLQPAFWGRKELILLSKQSEN
jgi:hypothetical protein